MVTEHESGKLCTFEGTDELALQGERNGGEELSYNKIDIFRLAEDNFATNLKAIRRYASEEGKELAPDFEASLYYNINVNEDRKAALQESKRFLDTYYTQDYSRAFLENWVAFGSPQECIDKLRALVASGATTITLRLTGYDQEKQFKRVTEEVLSAFL